METFAPSILVLVLAAAVAAMFYYFHKHRNIPPGPRGLPFLGYAPFLGPHPQNILLELGKKYGNIFSIYMGPQLAIVLNDYEAIKAAFIGQADTFAGRADGFIFRYTNTRADGKVHGLILADGEPWKKARRFTLQTFRDLGIGKAKIQDRILEEAEYLSDIFSKNVGKPFDPAGALISSVANIVGAVSFGKRFNHDDPRFRQLVTDVITIPEYLAQAGPLQAYPLLRFLPGSLSKWLVFVARVKRNHDFLDGMIENHRPSYNENETRDYIDAVFHQQRKEKESGKTAGSVVHDYDLSVNLATFLGAGTETTALTLLWAFLYMLHYPEVQEKVHQEIDQQVGSAQSISVDEKQKLPYTEAVLREVQRLANVTPLGVLRSNVEETTLLGFRIPKRSFIIPNFLSVNRDPTLWEEPSAFKPERFLDANGKVTEPPQFMPFSLGKRACVGESLARMEIFLFFSNIMQRFELLPSPGHVLPTVDQFTTGISCRPFPYLMNVVRRE